MTNRHKIGFIFINEIHHINHFITIAIELAKTNDVSILTFPSDHTYLFKKINLLKVTNINIEQLKTQTFRDLTDKLKKRKLPRNNFWVKKNSKYIFKNFDALVFTGLDHQNLLKAKGTKKFPKFIKCPHGIYGFDHGHYKFLSDFDFQLLFGEHYIEELKKRKLLGEHAIVGSTKLDALANYSKINLFDKTKKTVIYNPHFSPKSSSWKKFGLQILDFFESQDEYNLIFAPHINLFNRKGGEDVTLIPEKFFKSKKILIDLGSDKSVDMAYIDNADIYLGDISSQVYEFIINPRPCIFINSEKIDFQDIIHYRFWQCGNVIEKIDELDATLKNSDRAFEIYKLVQEIMNSENCYIEYGSTASERAANAIIQFLDKSLKEKD